MGKRKKPRRPRKETIEKYKAMKKYWKAPGTDPSYENIAHVFHSSKSTVKKAEEYHARKYRAKNKKPSKPRGWNLKKGQYDGDIGRINSRHSH